MPVIKTVGVSGQITLGKELAGKHVLIDQVETGVWVLKLGTFVLDCERWLFDPKVSKDLERAVDWAEKHPPAKTDLAALEKRSRS